jgi:hypothetical protein
MTPEARLEMLLEELRQALPDPFELRPRYEEFIGSPAARELLADGDRSAQRIIQFLESNPDPALARPAMLVLARFAPEVFYPRLLGILARANRGVIEALDAGFWFMQVPEGQVAQDLVGIVRSSGNPYPLLLLQRPVAKVVRPSLAELVKQRRLPESLFALYCYSYGTGPEDAPLLTLVSAWTDIPEMAAAAGVDLLKLGSKEGLAGIRAGLVASDLDLRKITYQEAAQFLSRSSMVEAGYDPFGQGEEQQAAADRPIRHLQYD